MDDLFLFLVWVWLMCAVFAAAGFIAEKLQ